jgi:ATP-dependent DNA ligase
LSHPPRPGVQAFLQNSDGWLSPGLEGIIAKTGRAFIGPTFRSKNWQKIKRRRHIKCVICGCTKNPTTNAQVVGGFSTS